jgi:hemerythrin HHE cation binding domain-containing protein
MKRSPALHDLSRDHHHALDVARRLRRAGPVDLADALASLGEFWSPQGERHFALEEDILLGAVPADDAEWAAAADRVRTEHADLRARIATVAGLDAAHDLGRRLHDHVRFEERTLFPALERRLGEAELERLGERLAAAG